MSTAADAERGQRRGDREQRRAAPAQPRTAATSSRQTTSDQTHAVRQDLDRAGRLEQRGSRAGRRPRAGTPRRRRARRAGELDERRTDDPLTACTGSSALSPRSRCRDPASSAARSSSEARPPRLLHRGADLVADQVVVRRAARPSRKTPTGTCAIDAVVQPGQRERLRRVGGVRVVARPGVDAGDVVDDVERRRPRAGPRPCSRAGAPNAIGSPCSRRHQPGLRLVAVLQHVEGAVVEDRAVLVDLDQRGAAVLGGRRAAPT